MKTERTYQRELFIWKRSGEIWYWWQHLLFLQILEEEHRHQIRMDELKAKLYGHTPPESGFIH